MPKLVVLSEAFRGKSFNLEKDEYTIGRVESCDICFPEPTVSTHHLTLRKEPDGNYKVEDHGSTNGVRVNGSRVTEHSLTNTDIIQAGILELLYEDPTMGGVTSSLKSSHTDIRVVHTPDSTVSRLPNLSPYGAKRELSEADRTNVVEILRWSIVGLGLLALAALVYLALRLV